jgi:hypothetical protein
LKKENHNFDEDGNFLAQLYLGRLSQAEKREEDIGAGA